MSEPQPEGMLQGGRIPLSETEHAAVDKLAAENSGVSLGLTRRDPGETGPLIVTADGVEYQINEDGTRRKL